MRSVSSAVRFADRHNPDIELRRAWEAYIVCRIAAARPRIRMTWLAGYSFTLNVYGGRTTFAF